MLKKVVSLLFVLVLTLGISTVVFASDDPNSINHKVNQGLTLYSEQVSDGAWTYAGARFMFYYNSWIAMNPEMGRGGNSFLGTPFTILGTQDNVYYFPIITDGVAVGVFIVASFEENGQRTYFGTLTGVLADELNSLLNSAHSSPIQLAFDNGNLFAQIDNDIVLIMPSPWGGEPEWISSYGLLVPHRAGDFLTVAPFNEAISNFTLPLPIPGNFTEDDFMHLLSIADNITGDEAIISEGETNLDSVVPLFIPSNALATQRFRIEQQGQRPWCGAYATSLIFRFFANNTANPTAYTLMREVHSPLTIPYYELVRFNFTVSDTIATGRLRGFRPFETGRLTPLGAVTEINRGRPIYMVGEATAPRVRHAWVIRGFTSNFCPFDGTIITAYSVWNPWNRFGYDVMNASTNRITTFDGRLWLWVISVSGW